MKLTAMTIKSTEIQVGDRISPIEYSGQRVVKEVIRVEGMVNVYWVDGGYYQYYKVSDTVKVLRWEEKEEGK